MTTPTTTDVVVSGVSLVRLVELCETPCVHIAAAVIPGTHGRPSNTEQASVVVARVVDLPRPGVITLDADLTSVTAFFAEARLIGRASTAMSLPFELSSPREAGGMAPSMVLPSDIAVGDLIAVPCADAVCLRELRAAARS
jgi:hypothetical protein